jgi:hypothetical protein
VRTAQKKTGEALTSAKVEVGKLNSEKEKGSTPSSKERPQSGTIVRHFLGPPPRFDFDLVPGLKELVGKAAGDVRDIHTSPAQQIAASRNAIQQIADGAVGFFHAGFYFAGRGHSWAIRLLTEFAISATSLVEAIVERRSPTDGWNRAVLLDQCSRLRKFISSL